MPSCLLSHVCCIMNFQVGRKERSEWEAEYTMRIYHDTNESNKTTLGNFLVTELAISFGKGLCKIKNFHSSDKNNYQ